MAILPTNDLMYTTMQNTAQPARTNFSTGSPQSPQPQPQPGQGNGPINIAQVRGNPNMYRRNPYAFAMSRNGGQMPQLRWGGPSIPWADRQGMIGVGGAMLQQGAPMQAGLMPAPSNMTQMRGILPLG